ncbi:MAG: P1 family peptidase [Myxococcota bacterium]
MSAVRTITAVPGVRAAHATDEDGQTGVTVLRFDEGARGAVWIPGSAIGSRELNVLAAGHTATRVHGLCLSGGSAFGLSAADGVMAALLADGVGYQTEYGQVPIVPAAILFDLHTASVRPGPTLGEAATRAASREPLPQGRFGAGRGARVGMASGTPAPGGVGSAAVEVTPFTIGAVAAVNALGSIRDPKTGTWVAGGPVDWNQAPTPEPRQQTTLVAVVTDAPLDRDAATVIAKMASAGMARAIEPAFSPFDGDVVFAFSTREGPPVERLQLLRLGAAAADLVATAIVRGVQPPA